MDHRAPPKGLIIVTGMAFYLPLPGVIYQVLHYMTGLRRLGYDVYYVEDSYRWVYDTSIDDIVGDATPNVAILSAVFDRYGFGGKWAYRSELDANGCFGLDASGIVRLYREADAMLNVTGQDLRGDQLLCRRRIYIESDPFATQVRVSQGDAVESARLAAHDTHFTFGENIGAADCRIPETSIRWLPTRQPVDAELWKPPSGNARNAARRSYSTITSWVNHVDSVVYEGERYFWQKDREFERFAELPKRSPARFELASNGGEYVPRIMSDNGWNQVSVRDVAGDVESYRRYVWSSRAEFTVARDQYVRPVTGWFSDRSACYLAAGRPVITQETGFSKFLPTGQGLFAFSEMEDILTAVEAIEADYDANSRAAREIGREYFAAEKVVGSLMERADLA
ncbi:MAG TPA: hypothetical protein VHM24_13345 [Gemmatimonadaceae bacterium]|nr:hypothetical protein [Gemmatimonadaceae bacterium]